MKSKNFSKAFVSALLKLFWLNRAWHVRPLEIMRKLLRVRVIHESDHPPTTGHLGIARTAGRISRKYKWSGMFRDVAKCKKLQFRSV